MILLTVIIVVLCGVIPMVGSLSSDPVIKGYYTDNYKLVQEFRSPGGNLTDCIIYGDPSTAQDVLAGMPPERRHLVDEAAFRTAVSNCNNFQLQVGTVLRSRRSVLKGIYPGTKWCGKGNIAETNVSVGSLEAEDTCCRIHDQCLPKIRVGETRYGITNEGPYTAFHCELCDRQFYNCMKTVNSGHSNFIGFVFFNVIGVKCFEQDYPIVCSGWWVFESCSPDTNRPKEYQFKDFPDSY